MTHHTPLWTTTARMMLALFLVGTIATPLIANAGWQQASGSGDQDTTYAIAEVVIDRQFEVQYANRSLGLFGTFEADVFIDGEDFEIHLVDMPAHGQPCLVDATHFDGIYEQWNSTTCDPHRLFSIMPLVFPAGIDEELWTEFWGSEGPGITVGGDGGGGVTSVGVSPGYGKEDGNDNGSDCLATIGTHCAAAFAGAWVLALTATAVGTPAVGMWVGGIAALGVGLNCGAHLYQDCRKKLVEGLFAIVFGVQVVFDPGFSVDVQDFIDLCDSLAGAIVQVEESGQDPDGTMAGFAVLYDDLAIPVGQSRLLDALGTR